MAKLFGLSVVSPLPYTTRYKSFVCLLPKFVVCYSKRLENFQASAQIQALSVKRNVKRQWSVNKKLLNELVAPPWGSLLIAGSKPVAYVDLPISLATETTANIIDITSRSVCIQLCNITANAGVGLGFPMRIDALITNHYQQLSMLLRPTCYECSAFMLDASSSPLVSRQKGKQFQEWKFK